MLHCKLLNKTSIMSNKYERSSVQKVANPAPLVKEVSSTSEEAPPASSTYEKIGVLDVSVYSNCEYPQEEGYPSCYTRCYTPNLKQKRAIFVVCTVALVAMLVINLLLGIGGVTKSICSTAAKCKMEEISSSMNANMTSHTEQLPMETEVLPCVCIIGFVNSVRY